MRVLILVAALLVMPRPAAAEPLRIAIECQGWGRTKACPAFLLGFVEHNPVFLSSPRSDAQVVLYYNVREVANTDHVHLRFVGELDGAPPVVEIEVELDTRADDDAQRAQLEPAFVRGAALYVAALHPDAVTIALGLAAAEEIVAPRTSPWGFVAQVNGFGNWTRGYQSMSLFGAISLSRIEKTSTYSLSVDGSYGLSRQPPLVIDGMEVSLDTSQYSTSARLFGARHLDDHWSIGGSSSVWHEDPEGQFELGWDASAGLEWDRFAADDPRGNRLAVRYVVGWEIDKYNAPNELRQRFTQFATHQLAAFATVRDDKIGYGLSMSIWGELIHPMVRHTIIASPFIEIQLGDHVDLSLSLSATKRAIPATVVDPSNYEQVIRASYAEPLSAYGSIGLRFHWDRTNGARNDRFQ